MTGFSLHSSIDDRSSVKTEGDMYYKNKVIDPLEERILERVGFAKHIVVVGSLSGKKNSWKYIKYIKKI